MHGNTGAQKIKIVCQPANSPDFNVLDLGFFRSLQSYTQKRATPNTETLVNVVEQAYKNYPYEKILDSFITLQVSLESSLRDLGGNSGKMTHINKSSMNLQQKLNFNLSCDSAVYTTASNYLHNPQNEP